jgi:hypothetical protein
MTKEKMTPHPGDATSKKEKPARKPGFKFHYWEFFKSKHCTGADGKYTPFFRAGSPKYQGEVLENDFAKKLAAEMPLQNSGGQAVTIVEHVPSGFYAYAILHPRDQRILYGKRLFITTEPKFRKNGRRIVLGRLQKAHPELFEIHQRTHVVTADEPNTGTRFG